ncbi:MAG: hypothetical protein CFH01_01112 [Alphaproteobacteria bacterium MarineAlpha2_Bin1]|nr:MAG: hypothetical protein CFH01_01112 [Alphaproteobacteria bacterium MarineAlpha2_Bin1]
MKHRTLIIFCFSLILINVSYGCGKKNNIKSSNIEEIIFIL